MFKNLFKNKKSVHQIVMKLSFNDEIIIYPTEKGWELIFDMYGDKFIAKHKTDDGGYKDQFHEIITDLGNMFHHGSDLLYSHFEIITHKW